MARSALAGSRIRERRMQAGVRQADLAAMAGISASYLNLIEHNRRNVGAALLRRLAGALSVAPEVLSEGPGAALTGALRDAASAAGGAQGAALPPAPDLDRIEEFVGRFPGWAALLARLHDRGKHLERNVEALSDRIANDPYLSGALHDLLSAVTGVRATAAILAETEDLEPELRARFHGNLEHDSLRLARGAEALAAYLDGSAARERGLAAPQDGLEAWLAGRGYHVPELEGPAPQTPEALVAATPELAAEPVRALALDWLTRYQNDARALPLAPFVVAMREIGPEPGRLALRFGADPGAVFRRLACLPGGEEDGDEAGAGAGIGLVTCDASGTLTFRKPARGFALPRFGAACPLWPLYQALRRPMAPICATVEMAGQGARRFRAYALCQLRHPEGFGGREVAEAMMLIVPGGEAGPQPVQPVGTACRICPRKGCPARREPSIMAEDA